VSTSALEPILSVRDLQIAVPAGKGEALAVRGVSFDLQAGARLGLVGESGSGKSLTALALMRMLAPSVRIRSGQVMLNGRDVMSLTARQMCAVRGSEIAMIYQNPMAALNPVLTIGDQLVEGLRIHSSMPRSAARKRAIELLGDVGIPDPQRRMDSHPYQLSGGMRQRVVIAMALSCEPSVIIADEPTTALDVTTQARVLALLRQLVSSHGTAVVLISHDLEVAAEFCEEIQVMYAGRIVERSPSTDLFASPLHPYAKALLKSSCVLTTDLTRPIPVIPGQPPQPGNFPDGCAFAARCSQARETCTHLDPILERVHGRAVACHFPHLDVDDAAGADLKGGELSD
jgi:oligopeptide/dipeptide ABC transporter ATP-binding protein